MDDAFAWVAVGALVLSIALFGFMEWQGVRDERRTLTRHHDLS